MDANLRLKQEYEELEMQYELLSQKIRRLREANVTETDSSVKLQLENQLELSESDRNKVKEQLAAIESSLNNETKSVALVNVGSVEGAINTSVIAGRDIIIKYISEDLQGKIGEEIARLHSQIIKLLPAKDLLTELEHLKHKDIMNNTEADLEEYIKKLNDIETGISSQDPTQEPVRLLQQFNTIQSEIKVKIGRLNSKFIGYVHEATGSIELFQHLISKIGHKEVREEALTHLEVIRSLWKRLNWDDSTNKSFDVLGENSYDTMSLLVQIEDRKDKVKQLIKLDRIRRNKTIAVVIGYITLAITVFTIIIWRHTGQSLVNQTSLNQQKLPILNIPWPVIVWSLIGSFAAMIHQFNKKPIYDFGDAVKWMLTRPVQGAVLGCAFYLVLISGLFLFTGTTPNAGIQTPADEIILVLSFLVGFSDRFADQVFNSLVRKYSKIETEDKTSNQGNETK